MLVGVKNVIGYNYFVLLFVVGNLRFINCPLELEPGLIINRNQW